MVDFSLNWNKFVLPNWYYLTSTTCCGKIFGVWLFGREDINITLPIENTFWKMKKKPILRIINWWSPSSVNFSISQPFSTTLALYLSKSAYICRSYTRLIEESLQIHQIHQWRINRSVSIVKAPIHNGKSDDSQRIPGSGALRVHLLMINLTPLKSRPTKKLFLGDDAFFSGLLRVFFIFNFRWKKNN